MTEKRDQHSGVRHASDKLQDAIGGMTGRISAAIPKNADSFVENAAIGDLYEIAAAELALRRASAPEVSALAAQMFEDHTTSAHQLSAALEMNETQGLAPIPEELDTRRRTMYEHLERAPADKFDSMYLDQQVLAHEETLALLGNYGANGDNAQLRSFAMGAAPVVARHLQHVKVLKQQRTS